MVEDISELLVQSLQEDEVAMAMVINEIHIFEELSRSMDGLISSI